MPNSHKFGCSFNFFMGAKIGKSKEKALITVQR